MHAKLNTFKVWEDKYIVPTPSIHPIPYTMIYWGKKDLKYCPIWALWRHLDTQKALSHLSTWGTRVLEVHLGTQSTRALEYYKGTCALRHIGTRTLEGHLDTQILNALGHLNIRGTLLSRIYFPTFPLLNLFKVWDKIKLVTKLF